MSGFRAMTGTSGAGLSRVGRLLVAAASASLLLAAAGPAHANTTPQSLPFSQNWSNTGLITTDNNWSGVPGIVGYRGDDLTTTLDTNPQSVTRDGSATPVNVKANQTNPNTLLIGGLAEFQITDPTVALQPSTTADAPHLVFYLNTTASANIDVSARLRDIDGSADNAAQQVALQYRVGNTGDFQNVSGASYVPDATTGPSEATQETILSGRLGNDAAGKPEVQVRVITTNATGNDEWVGVDDISVTSALPLDALKISEFRTRGRSSAIDPTGEADEFVEITNRSQQTVDVSNVAVITCGGVFGAGSRIHLFNLGGSLAPGQSTLANTGNGYTGGIDANKTPDYDVGYGAPGASSEGYAINVGNSSGALFDQVGEPGSSCAEGAGLTTPTAEGNYSFVRRAGFNSLPDTNNNAADFDFVSDTAGTFGPISALGLPGPENLNDPHRLGATEYRATLFSGTNANLSPNRTYTASDPRGTNGVLRIRRTFTNRGSTPIEELRFRIYRIDTKNNPPGSTRADLRAIDSEPETVATRDVATTIVEGACPAAEPECHGLNTRVQVDLANIGDSLAPGASVDFSVDLAVQRTGSYVLAFFPEARFTPPVPTA